MTSLAIPAWWMAGGLRTSPACWPPARAASRSSPTTARCSPYRWTRSPASAGPGGGFGGGCTLLADGHRYELTFVRPGGAPAAPPSLLETAESLAAVQSPGAVPAIAGLFDVRSGRAAGASWKRPYPTDRPGHRGVALLRSDRRTATPL